MAIHPTAVVDKTARLADDVEIGPYAYVGPQVELASGVVLDHHSSVERLTTIGEGTRIWPYASVGADPQDLKYKGQDTTLSIGKGCRIRECVTINRGTVEDKGFTKIGDNCLLMAYSHVAHDCVVGNGVIMANSSTLAGHITMEDRSSLGGLVAVHQFTRIGAFCYVGGMSAVTQDLAPYTLVEGNRAKPRALNMVGLTRAGFSQEALEALKKAFKIVFRTRTPIKKALDQVREEVPDLPEIRNFIDFINNSARGVAR